MGIIRHEDKPVQPKKAKPTTPKAAALVLDISGVEVAIGGVETSLDWIARSLEKYVGRAAIGENTLQVELFLFGDAVDKIADALSRIADALAKKPA